MKDHKLSPCPFCLSNFLRIPKNFNIVEGKLVGTSSCVSCQTCGADGPSCRYVDDVIKAWNERGV